MIQIQSNISGLRNRAAHTGAAAEVIWKKLALGRAKMVAGLAGANS
jgi:hypothetical protein